MVSENTIIVLSKLISIIINNIAIINVKIDFKTVLYNSLNFERQEWEKVIIWSLLCKFL